MNREELEEFYMPPTRIRLGSLSEERKFDEEDFYSCGMRIVGSCCCANGFGS
jgi:hypothetical protein